MWHGFFLSWWGEGSGGRGVGGVGGGGLRGMGAVVQGCKLKSWPLFPVPQEMACLTLKLSIQCLNYGRVYQG